MAAKRTGQTKYVAIAEQIRDRVVSGEYSPGIRIPSETHFATLFDTTPVTIGKALNLLTEEGLLVRRRGSGTYVADRRYQPIVVGRHVRIGVLWSSPFLPQVLQDSFQGNMTRGAIDCWGIQGAQVTHAINDPNAPTRGTWDASHRGITVECIGERFNTGQRHPPLDAVVAGGFDGLLALSVTEDDWIEELLDLGIPTVLLDYSREKFLQQADIVYVDPMSGYRRAVAAFAGMGLKKIHFIHALVGRKAPSTDMTPEARIQYLRKNQQLDPDSPFRMNAYRIGMADNGLPLSEDWIHAIGFSRKVLGPFAEKLADLPDDERPEAVICHSMEHAETCRRVFEERGLPLKAAGAVDQAYEGPCYPIHVDGVGMGAAGAALLTSRLQQRNRPLLRVGMPMEFIDHKRQQ